MTTDESGEAAFRAFILPWVQTQEPRAAAVVSVRTYGTDWAGDTEGGFHSEADTEVVWADDGGAERNIYLEGERLGEFWAWVIAHFGSTS